MSVLARKGLLFFARPGAILIVCVGEWSVSQQIRSGQISIWEGIEYDRESIPRFNSLAISIHPRINFPTEYDPVLQDRSSPGYFLRKFLKDKFSPGRVKISPSGQNFLSTETTS